VLTADSSRLSALVFVFTTYTASSMNIYELSMAMANTRFNIKRENGDQSWNWKLDLRRLSLPRKMDKNRICYTDTAAMQLGITVINYQSP